MNRDKSIRHRIYEIRRRLATQRRSRHGHVPDSISETTMLERFVIDVSVPKVIYEIAAPSFFVISRVFQKTTNSHSSLAQPGRSKSAIIAMFCR